MRISCALTEKPKGGKGTRQANLRYLTQSNETKSAALAAIPVPLAAKAGDSQEVLAQAGRSPWAGRITPQAAQKAAHSTGTATERIAEILESTLRADDPSARADAADRHGRAAILYAAVAVVLESLVIGTYPARMTTCVPRSVLTRQKSERFKTKWIATSNSSRL